MDNTLDFNTATDILKSVQECMAQLMKHRLALVKLEYGTCVVAYVALEQLEDGLKRDWLNPMEGDIDDDKVNQAEYLKSKDDE